MEFFKKTNINFLGFQRIAIFFSIILSIFSVFFIIYKGINWGLDFTGGYAIEIHLNSDFSNDQIQRLKNKFSTISGIEHIKIVTFGGEKDLRISIQTTDMDTKSNKKIPLKIIKSIKKVFKKYGKILSVNYIGPEIGKDLMKKGFLAILISLFAMMFYISIRFTIQFSIGSIIALAHDPLIIFGFFSFFQIPFDLNTLAAILAVIGYSLNDTVVIYDRIREKFKNFYSRITKSIVLKIVNQAINETLSRTIITSGLTLSVLLVLYFLGGETLYGFSLALIIGVIIGTYSSIYIASALAITISLKKIIRNKEKIL